MYGIFKMLFPLLTRNTYVLTSTFKYILHNYFHLLMLLTYFSLNLDPTQDTYVSSFFDLCCLFDFEIILHKSM